MFRQLYMKALWIFKNCINYMLTPLSLKKGDVKCHEKSYICKSVKMYNSTVDKYSYIGGHSILINTNVGKFCSIAGHCYFGLSNHTSTYISTSPIFTEKKNGTHHSWIEKNISVNSQMCIEIGNDIWIGERVTIMGGVKVGDGAIIGTGAIVTKDIPPYAVAVGVPAKVVKYRFDENTIAKLLKLKWWNLSEDILKQNISLFQTDQIKIEKLEALINNNI